MEEEEEIWKFYKETNSIPWGKRVYEVSNLGNAKINGELIKFNPNQKGYIRFCNDYLHRIVAKLFIPNPENKPEVDHIDTNKLNNKAENLSWTTRTENCNNPLTRKHNSEAQKGLQAGEKNPMWGKNAEDFMTEEAIKEKRRKQSESLKGKKRPPFTEEHCKNISKSLTGRKMSEDFCKKRSELSKGENNPMYGVPSPVKGMHWKLGEDGKRIYY